MKLLGLGDNVLDYYIKSKEIMPGGNALNVSAHAAILQQSSSYLGNIASDNLAKYITSSLDAVHVDYQKCPIIPNSNTKCCIYDIVAGERQFIETDLGKNWSGPLEITDDLLTYISTFDLVHSSCNAKMEKEMIKLKDIKTLYSFDFGEKEKYRTDEYLKMVCTNLDLALFSIKKMNQEEALIFAQKIADYGARNVILTMGIDGQYIYNGKKIVHCISEAIEPVDTIGAGDAFVTAFMISAFKNGWRKGKALKPKVIEKAAFEASEYAKENCLIKGAFGIVFN